ncbi:MAG: hypothetical protein KF726_27755 [Anaerolineae bacterium]|nr:hypothetical protein [Anaerolineae bacterium]
MSEQVFIDALGDEIVLADSVREMILLKHPEVASFTEKLPDVLMLPDEIRRSFRDERVVLYYRYDAAVLDGKWITVAVKRIDRNYISTIYATDRIKSGDVVWTKNT